jgi:hypothetical protein
MNTGRRQLLSRQSAENLATNIGRVGAMRNLASPFGKDATLFHQPERC